VGLDGVGRGSELGRIALFGLCMGWHSSGIYLPICFLV